MEEEQLIQQVERLLRPEGDRPGILHRHGRVMMSNWSTVKRAPYYVLGINPGAGEVNPAPAGESVGDSLSENRRGQWSYWLDEAKANHRDLFTKVMKNLESDPRSVPVSNALFLRSQGVDVFPADYRKVFVEHCAPVHNLLLNIVTPHVVVCFGIPTWELMTGRSAPSHWRFNPDTSFKDAGIDYFGGVLLLPHFAQGGAMAWRNNVDTLTQAIVDAREYAKRVR